MGTAMACVKSTVPSVRAHWPSQAGGIDAEDFDEFFSSMVGVEE